MISHHHHLHLQVALELIGGLLTLMGFVSLSFGTGKVTERLAMSDSHLATTESNFKRWRRCVRLGYFLTILGTIISTCAALL